MWNRKLLFISYTAADKSAAEMTSVYHEDKKTLSSVSLLPHGDSTVLCWWGKIYKNRNADKTINVPENGRVQHIQKCARLFEAR